MDHEIQLHKNPFPKQSVFGMVSTLWYLIYSTLLYWRSCTKFKFKNIIVDTVSTNICPLCDTYLYVNWRTKFKWIYIFIGIMTYFKIIHNEPVLWALSFWQAAGKLHPKSPNVFNALPQDMVINKINFEYKLYISYVDYQPWLIIHQKPN